MLAFTEPWFFNRQLAFNADLFYRDAAYVSPENVYTESRAGMRPVRLFLEAVASAAGL